MSSSYTTAVSDVIVLGAAATVAALALTKGKPAVSTSLGTEAEDDSLLEPEKNQESPTRKGEKPSAGEDMPGQMGAKPPPGVPPKISAAAEVRDGEV